MIRNYLKIALKVLLRRKFFTFVSLFGITFTLTVLLVVTALVQHVLLPTPLEPHRNRTMYVTYMHMFGESSAWNGDPGFGFLDKYCRDLPGVERMSILRDHLPTVTYLDGQRVELDLRVTDAEYWRIYDHEWIEGAPYTVEDDAAGRRVAVLSREAREQLLDGRSALGERVTVGTDTYEVIGVVENVSQSADHAYAHVWVPMGTLTDAAYRADLMGGFNALLLAKSRDDFDTIRSDFAARLPHVEFPDPESFHTMSGRPFTRAELLATEFGDPDDVNVLRKVSLSGLGLALAFMLLPSINLVSVSLSRIFERSSEIGVRKAFGAASRSLAGQFIFENVVLCLVGGALAFALAAFLLGAFNLSGILPHSDFSVNVRVFLAGLGLAVFLGIVSGAYPALRMSRFHPVEALRGGAR